jgi:hypothetical protein
VITKCEVCRKRRKCSITADNCWLCNKCWDARFPRSTTDCAFVEENGTFHCPKGHTHSNGPVNGSNVYRCLECGSSWRIRGLVKLK